MANSLVLNPLTETPPVIYLKDYLPPAYLIEDIHLHFELEESLAIVKSRMAIRRNPARTDQVKELILNGEELELIAIALDGKPLATTQYQLTSESLIIHQVPENFTLEITTKIKPQQNTALSGLYRSQQCFCTQCEAHGFRRITYFIDRPDVLARYTTTLIADEKRYPFLLSNGNLIASTKLKNGRHSATWQDPFKKPSYLFALVAGDLDLVEDEFITQSGRRVTLRIYVEKGYRDQTQHAMQSIKEAMRWDEKNYGREYDLDVYMIVAINDFNSGAMENKGLNIFNTKYILAKPETATDDDFIHISSVIAHEYFHNWTGNRVTCRDWFQLSLKEGLTIFRDQSFTEDMLSRAVARIRDVHRLREMQFPEDAGPLAHAVQPESYIEINNFYTATVYGKGAEIARMLKTILGESLFRQGMDLYFARHDGHAVTIEDFIKAMADVSGIDLGRFVRWYQQAGTPILDVADDYDANQHVYTLTIYQSCLPTPGQPEKKPLHIPVSIGLLDENGREIALDLNDEPVALEKVLQVQETSQVYRFKNISSHPIPSLLRNFSAPVKLNFSYSDTDLRFLFKHDQDAFNRWEAGQKYMERLLLQLVQAHQQQKTLELPHELLDMFEYILQEKLDDKFLLAEMLIMPSEKYIGEQLAVIDVDAIHVAREFVLRELARKLQPLFLQVYQQHHDPKPPHQFSIRDAGNRQLKNRCLAYLMLLSDEQVHEKIGMRQFETSLSVNMTDTVAALSALSNIDSPLRNKALDQFYTSWKHDTLVMDKWFAIQALSKLPFSLQQVKKLMQHEMFDIRNPNKVYSLIGTFCQRNAVRFHAKNGEGYLFLTEYVLRLDKLNPQIAARMVNPLTNWKRYDKDRQQLMREQLELILQEHKISKNLYELVSKSL